MRKITFFIFIIFGFLHCKTGKVLSKSVIQTHELEIEESIVQLVSCINKRQFDCVANHYAENFRGIQPLVEFDSKKALIASIEDNYTKNNFKIKIAIDEIEARAEMGFVILEWQIYKAGNDEDEIFFQQKCLNILEKNNGQWQLKRSLFYAPN